MRVAVLLLALLGAAPAVGASPVLRGLPNLAAMAKLSDGLDSALRNLSSAHQLRLHGPQRAVGGDRPVPEVTVNLDLPPEQRWVALAPQFRDKFQPLVNFLLSIVSPEVLQLVEGLMDLAGLFMSAEHRAEIVGLARAAGQPVGQMVLMNLVYEIASGCTSIVATRRGADGGVSILHGRNLDYPVPGLSDLEITVRFQRGGQTQYIGTTYFGYIGLLTGMRPGGFSVSIDQRTTGGNVVTNFLEAALRGGKSIGFFLREVLEQETYFGRALQRLATTRLASVAYLIIAGTRRGEGAVVTRDRERAVDVWMLNEPERWYLVETNVSAPLRGERCDRPNGFPVVHSMITGCHPPPMTTAAPPPWRA